MAHRSGDVPGAIAAYRRALETVPNHADSLHLLGVAMMQSGDHPAAAEMIGKAVSVNNSVPAYHDHLGLTLRQMGKPADAEAHHRRALEIDADFAPAQNNLAGTLLALGKLAEAETAARRAIELKPGDTETLTNLGQILLARGRASGAVEAFETAFKGRSLTSEMLSQLGPAYQRAGRRAEAEKALTQAAEMMPERAGGWSRLGVFHLNVEQFDEAAAAFRKALEINPADMGSETNLGVALWRGGRFDEAEIVFQDVLDRSPEEVPALLGLAALRAAEGQNGQARTLYRRVLEIEPGNVDVYHNLGADGDAGLSDEDAGHLATLVGKRSLSDDDRAKVSFALAGYLRRAGADEAAFDLYTTANAFRTAAFDSVGSGFDQAAQEQFIEAREAIFSEDFFAARREFGRKTKSPVFVVGMPRSGTTLVEQILASHPSVHGAGERRDIAVIGIQRSVAEIDGEDPYPQCLRRMTAEISYGLADEYLAQVGIRARRATRIIDKMPFNFMHLGLIALLFPEAKIIHCRRDMRDVGLSCFFTNFADTHPWSTDLRHIGHFIRSYERMMRHWHAVLPLPILNMDYETLVGDLEGQSRRMIEHLGLRWNSACLRFHESARPVSTAARAQVRQPIYTSAIGRWREYDKWLHPLTSILSE